MILAGDIGGTHTRLAFFDDDLTIVEEKTWPSGEHESLEEIVELFLASSGVRPASACFGLAGPVRDDRSRITNLPWVIDARGMESRLGIARVRLLNDLEANAWGIAALAPGAFETIREGVAEASGNRAVISAGTGLGQAGLFWDGAGHRPWATEGGHCSFAPRDEIEIELLRHLGRRFGAVSWERVVSGPGLANIFAFLSETRRGEVPDWLAARIEEGDPAAAISAAALEGTCGLAVQALDLFVGFYGAEAGNLALKTMATGGVFLGGGIAPKILEKLRTRRFTEAFLDKGPMRPLLEGMPVRVILEEKTALIGAARHAALSL